MGSLTESLRSIDEEIHPDRVWAPMGQKQDPLKLTTWGTTTTRL